MNSSRVLRSAGIGIEEKSHPMPTGTDGRREGHLRRWWWRVSPWEDLLRVERGRSWKLSLHSPSPHHHLSVLPDACRQVALLSSLLLPLSHVKVGEGEEVGIITKGEKEGTWFYSVLTEPTFRKQGQFRWRAKEVLSRADAHWEEISGQRKRENKKERQEKWRPHSAFCLLDSLKIWLHYCPGRKRVWLV